MVYFLPAVAPGICIAILFRYLWQPDYGFANQIMMFLNLPEQMWLNDDMMVKWCIKAQGFILGGGMSMLIYLAALKEIPMELFEAAYMDGASFLQRVRYIVFPSISSVIKVLFIMQMIADLNSFDEVLTMTGGGPAGATETMILYAYNTAVQKMDYSYSAAMANIVMILALGITAFHTYASSKKS